MLRVRYVVPDVTAAMICRRFRVQRVGMVEKVRKHTLWSEALMRWTSAGTAA